MNTWEKIANNCVILYFFEKSVGWQYLRLNCRTHVICVVSWYTSNANQGMFFCGWLGPRKRVANRICVLYVFVFFINFKRIKGQGMCFVCFYVFLKVTEYTTIVFQVFLCFFQL